MRIFRTIMANVVINLDEIGTKMLGGLRCKFRM